MEPTVMEIMIAASHQVRKEDVKKINPENAEVDWCSGQFLDPYGIGGLRDDERCAARNYLARCPGSEIWVWFGDWPRTTREKLWEMHSSKLVFPAGLPVQPNLCGA